MSPLADPPAPLRTRWLGLLRLTRASIALSPIADALAGMSIAAATMGWPAPKQIAIGLLVPLTLFCFGMAQNDLADRKRDQGTRRPLATGEVAVTTARALVIALGLLCVLLACALPPPAQAIVVVMLIAISAYNLTPTHLGLFGPLVLGSIRGLDLALGAAIGGAWTPAVLPAVAYLGFIGAISCVSRMEDGVWRPTRARVLAATVVAAGSAAAGPFLITSSVVGPARVVMLLSVGLLIAWIVRCFRALPSGPLSAGPALQRYVGGCLTAIFFFDAAIAAGTGAIAVAFVILLMFPIARALVRALPPS